jgi:hypothetical protein
LKDLVEDLDADLDEVEDAILAVEADALEQAVEDELLTQEQADLILAGKALKNYIDRQALVAGALGIGVDDLEAAREAGTTIFELAEAEGLDMADVRDNLEAAHAEAVQDAIGAGVITQEQANQLQAGPGFGFGGHGGLCDGRTPGPGFGPGHRGSRGGHGFGQGRGGAQDFQGGNGFTGTSNSSV